MQHKTLPEEPPENSPNVDQVQPEVILTGNTEQNKRDWEVAKLIAETESLRMPYLKKPASWITLSIAIIGVVGTVFQWFNYKDELEEAEFKIHSAEFKYSESQTKILEAEDRLLELNETKAGYDSEIAFLNDQKLQIKTEIDILQGDVNQLRTVIGSNNQEEIIQNLNRIDQKLESTLENASIDYASLEPDNQTLFDVLGQPGERQASFELPYPMRLSWNKNSVINSFKVHELALPYFEKVFKALLEKGLKEEANLFGGCLNVRKLRGGSQYSSHSWGIEIDLDPENNQLKWGPERWKMDPRVVEIFENNGFFWRGRLGFDATSFVLSTETLEEIRASN